MPLKELQLNTTNSSTETQIKIAKNAQNTSKILKIDKTCPQASLLSVNYFKLVESRCGTSSTLFTQNITSGVLTEYTHHRIV